MHAPARLWTTLTLGLVLVFALAILVVQRSLKREVHSTEAHSNKKYTESAKGGYGSVLNDVSPGIPGAGSPPERTIESPSRLPKKLSEAAQRHRESILLRNQYLLERIEIDGSSLARLKDLLVERDLAQIDAKESARALGLANARIAEAVNKAASAVDDEIREALGDENYEKYAGLAKESSYRGMFKRDFEGYLADAGAKLTTEQGDILARVFTDIVYREKAGRELSSSTIASDSMLRPNEAEFLRRIAGIVSRNQLELIERRFKNRNSPPAGKPSLRPGDRSPPGK